MTMANAQLQGMIELFETMSTDNAKQVSNWESVPFMSAYYEGKRDAYAIVVERLEAAVRAVGGDE